MGANEDPSLWSDEAFLDKIHEALQKDGIIVIKRTYDK